MSQVDLARALYSEGYAKKCYINYYYKDNSMGITAAEMGQITGTWDSKVNSWKAYAESQDENEYEIDDSDYKDYVAEGRKNAKDASGYKNTGWQKAGQITRTSVDGVVALGGNTWGMHAAGEIGEKELKGTAKNILGGGNKAQRLSDKAAKLNEKARQAQDIADKAKEAAANAEKGTDAANKAAKEADKAAKKAEKATEKAEKATKKAEEAASTAKESKINVGILVQCGIAVATAAMYRISKPNKTQKEAVDKYAENMGGQMELSMQTQDELITMDEELICNTDEANTVNDDANTAMAETKTDYDFYKNALEYLQKAKVSGHKFTKEETELWDECIKYMNEANGEITSQQEEAQAQVQEIRDDMETYQDGFDNSAENIGNVEGFAKEAESVDKSTQVQCYIEAASQGINALGAGKAAYEAISAGTASSVFGIGAVYLAAGALAGVAAVSDGFAAAEQVKWAGETGNEITAREATQQTNAETLESYNEKVDDYSGYVADVEDLELAVPDDVAPVEDAEKPEVYDPKKDPNKKNNG